MKFLTFFFCALTLSFSSFSQSKYLKKGSIGKVEQVVDQVEIQYGPVKFRELKEMVGENFLVLPMAKSLQHFGYQLIYRDKASSLTDHVSYDELSGKLLKLIDLSDGVHGTFADSAGNKYRITAYTNQFDSLVPEYDLDEASRLFLNKKLWLKTSYISTYDERLDEQGSINNLSFQPVTVIDILASEDDQQPVRFVVKLISGKVGFVDVNMSGSNQGYEYRKTYSFNNSFWTFNPKEKYKYPPAMWKFIEKGDVRLGMTRQQVILCIGEPDDINTSVYRSGSQEQWVYGDTDRTYYYFQNGVLTAQN